MNKPAHAITLWITDDDQIIVEYPDGQQIPVPSAEPSRLLTILRTQRERARPVDKLLLFRREFQAAFTHEDIVAKGKEVRKRHEDELTKTALRKEREKKARLKRIAARDKLKQANELLALVGL